MIIACPRCETSFSLPDGLFKPGKKARCSQCGNVFPMPEMERQAVQDDLSSSFGDTAAPSLPPLPPPAPPLWKKHLTALIAASAVLLLLILGYGGFLMYRSFTAAAPATATQEEAAKQGIPPEQQAAYEERINAISLDEVRQFVVDNAKIGRIAVIQGVAINVSQGPREYITIEAKLLDANKRVLASVRQLCGVPLTLFQLQYLSEAELKQTLTNRIAILTNNTNIPPGGKVNFAAVFTKVPDNMRTFEVRVIDVREAPAP